ncbi:MAG: hypothetical protein IJ649_08610 [Oscillospiraceae bacterium]|nr:hypothetical protein [Oscillospiraceae bacterium]
MILLEFNEGEESYNFAIGPKNEYASFEVFLSHAAERLLERDGYLSWEEYLEPQTYTPREIDAVIETKPPFTHGFFSFTMEQVIRAFAIGKHSCGVDITLGIETNEEYIFYEYRCAG